MVKVAQRAAWLLVERKIVNTRHVTPNKRRTVSSDLNGH